MNGASVAALITAAGVACAGLLALVQARRTTRGRVGTSEAAVLWGQAQQLRAEVVAQRDKAEAQRDRLIESQATSVLPALGGINAALGQITVVLAGNAEALAKVVQWIDDQAAANGDGRDDRPAGDTGAGPDPAA